MEPNLPPMDEYQEGEDVVACTYSSIEEAITEIPKSLPE